MTKLPRPRGSLKHGAATQSKKILDDKIKIRIRKGRSTKFGDLITIQICG